MAYDYTYDEKKEEIKINCIGSVYGASFEDFGQVMSIVIDRLMEIKKPIRLVMSETRDYEYDVDDVEKLLEIGFAVEKIVTIKKLLSLKNIAPPNCDKYAPERYSFLRGLVLQIKQDPVMAYKTLLREIRHQKIKEKTSQDKNCYQFYIENSLMKIKEILERTTIIRDAITQLNKIKDRSFYGQIFHPSVKPNFMFTRFMTIPPKDAELIERYTLEDSIVEIYKKPGEIRKIYHLIPPEFKLNDYEYEILDKARRYLGRHQPKESQLVEPGKIRENILKINQDMLLELDQNLDDKTVKRLSEILTRYTAGMGVLEFFLKDDQIQDIYVNAPIGEHPIYITHNIYGDCITNIIPSREDAESWATRFRLVSGRPLDEANPVLDTETEIKGNRSRVSIITRKLSPDGTGFAFRRHRFKPWTLTLFIKNKMINSFGAAVLWFLIDGGRTLLIAGTRGSGKTSLLGASMIQIMPSLRIVTVEDTLELPVEYMNKLGFNIERMKSRSVITHIETELAAEEAIRTALRLGDSCLIIGEVRSKEAIALYEAMRIGALANVVAGTIHGESAYGVFDRVVNDLGVPPTSFKATDVVIVANKIKSPDGLKSYRRVVEITEVLKHWKEDPMEEHGFANLFTYNAKDDMLVPTDRLLLGESEVLNSIASNVNEWKNNWVAVWDNLMLRKKILETLVETAEKTGKPELLESKFVIKSNMMFHLLSESVKNEIGVIDSKILFERWHNWLKEILHEY